MSENESDPESGPESGHQPGPESGDDLGPRPAPQIEPGETNPGGPDSADAGAASTIGSEEETGVIPDLDPNQNPAVDAAPEETRKGEDTSTEATRGSGDDGTEAATSDKESPA